MKLCGAVAAVLLVHQLELTVALPDQQLDQLWAQFKTTYNKTYANEAEEHYRRELFASSVDYIAQHNIQADLGQHGFTLGINEYSDWSNDEYSKFLLGGKLEPKTLNETELATDEELDYNREDWPSTVDWRKKGYVTPVKNQGPCGSCWAFAATGSLEGQHYKSTRKLVSLSEQNLVDCSRQFGNRGCQGGMPDRAFRYVAYNRGIDTEQCYPYEAKDGSCRFRRWCVGATCSGARRVRSGDERALMAAVAKVGPIAVAIDASHRSFRAYRGGVYDEPQCSATDINHAVLVVGYGTYGGKDYWLVKNSWGTSWGMGGYIMMSRNKRNQCAIANYASYPVV